MLKEKGFILYKIFQIRLRPKFVNFSKRIFKENFGKFFFVYNLKKTNSKCRVIFNTFSTFLIYSII